MQIKKRGNRFKPRIQVKIPNTTPAHYLTGKAALNLPAPEGTSGDWHFSNVFYDLADDNKVPYQLPLAGEGETVNTNHIYGDWGIYECSREMRGRGLILPAGMTAVYAANHFRAILDMVYSSLIRHHKVICLSGVTDDWLDTTEQKALLLDKAAEMAPHIPKEEHEELLSWIRRESIDAK